MTEAILNTLKTGGRIITRMRHTRRGMTIDTELCSRPTGLMAIAKAAEAGAIQVKSRTEIRKGELIEYELSSV
jgi:hypothetical protein